VWAHGTLAELELLGVIYGGSTFSAEAARSGIVGHCQEICQLSEEGVEAVLSRKPRATPSVPRIFDGEKEAKLIALACSEPPKGRARWILRLLENKVVELNIVDRASDSTIGRTLKKTSLSPISNSNGLFAGQQRSRMEDVLAVYTRVHDPDCPVVCLDETSKQLVAETRVPVPMKPGQPTRSDYE
jgi:hypothetical protein